MPIVRIDGKRITDWASFHDVFYEAFGFPCFYGRNMDAWIDCMTSLDEPNDGMTSVHGSATDPVVLQLDDANSVPAELFESITECSAFVNWRRLKVGDPAILMLSCYRTQAPEPPPAVDRRRPRVDYYCRFVAHFRGRPATELYTLGRRLSQ